MTVMANAKVKNLRYMIHQSMAIIFFQVVQVGVTRV